MAGWGGPADAPPDGEMDVDQPPVTGGEDSSASDEEMEVVPQEHNTIPPPQPDSDSDIEQAATQARTTVAVPELWEPKNADDIDDKVCRFFETLIADGPFVYTNAFVGKDQHYLHGAGSLLCLEVVKDKLPSMFAAHFNVSLWINDSKRIQRLLRQGH